MLRVLELEELAELGIADEVHSIQPPYGSLVGTTWRGKSRPFKANVDMSQLRLLWRDELQNETGELLPS